MNARFKPFSVQKFVVCEYCCQKFREWLCRVLENFGSGQYTQHKGNTDPSPASYLQSPDLHPMFKKKKIVFSTQGDYQRVENINKIFYFEHRVTGEV